MDAQVDDDDWTIESEDTNELVLGFTFRESSLPKKYQYLAGCKGQAIIDKQAKRLTKADFKSLKEVKIKLFKVPKFDLTINYQFDEENNTYHISREDLYIQAKLLGQLVDIEDVMEFSNYKKVK